MGRASRASNFFGHRTVFIQNLKVTKDRFIISLYYQIFFKENSLIFILQCTRKYELMSLFSKTDINLPTLPFIGIEWLSLYWFELVIVSDKYVQQILAVNFFFFLANRHSFILQPYDVDLKIKLYTLYLIILYYQVDDIRIRFYCEKNI